MAEHSMEQTKYLEELATLERGVENDVRPLVVSERERFVAKIRATIEEQLSESKPDLFSSLSELEAIAERVRKCSVTTLDRLQSWKDHVAHDVPPAWRERVAATTMPAVLIREKHKPELDRLHQRRLQEILRVLDAGESVELSPKEERYLFNYYSNHHSSANRSLPVEQVAASSVIIRTGANTIKKVHCEHQDFRCRHISRDYMESLYVGDQFVGQETQDVYNIFIPNSVVQIKVLPGQEKVWESLWTRGFEQVSKTLQSNNYKIGGWRAPRISLPVIKSRDYTHPIFNNLQIALIPKKELLVEAA